MNLYCNEVSSPVGKLKLVADESALLAILWEVDARYGAKFASAESRKDHPLLLAAEKQLAEYFAGSRTEFTVQLRMEGTEFQRRVWRQLQQIPFGKCCTYGELARAIGHPTAARAVGAANGQNPLSIIVPCHRVIGHGGALTGFAGGLPIKAHLIALERGLGGGAEQTLFPAGPSTGIPSAEPRLGVSKEGLAIPSLLVAGSAR